MKEVIARLRLRHLRSTIRVKDGCSTYYCKCFQQWPCDVEQLIQAYEQEGAGAQT